MGVVQHAAAVLRALRQMRDEIANEAGREADVAALERTIRLVEQDSDRIRVSVDAQHERRSPG